MAGTGPQEPAGPAARATPRPSVQARLAPRARPPSTAASMSCKRATGRRPRQVSSGSRSPTPTTPSPRRPPTGSARPICSEGLPNRGRGIRPQLQPLRPGCPARTRQPAQARGGPGPEPVTAKKACQTFAELDRRRTAPTARCASRSARERPPPPAAEPTPPLAPEAFAAMFGSSAPSSPPRAWPSPSPAGRKHGVGHPRPGLGPRRPGSILALVVDHGLRPESPAEAALSCANAGRGRWASPPGSWCARARATSATRDPGTRCASGPLRLCSRSRAATERGALHLLLAHHADDQAETVRMLGGAWGSGATGLAGMPAIREMRGLRLLRPLLAVPKARLTATLAAAGQPWLVDPAAPRHARGRLRAGPAFDPDGPWARSLAHAHGAARRGRAARGIAGPRRPTRSDGLRAARRQPLERAGAGAAAGSARAAARDRRRSGLSGGRHCARPARGNDARGAHHPRRVHHRAPRQRSTGLPRAGSHSPPAAASTGFGRTVGQALHSAPRMRAAPGRGSGTRGDGRAAAGRRSARASATRCRAGRGVAWIAGRLGWSELGRLPAA